MNRHSFLFQRRKGKSGGEGVRLVVLVGFEADVIHLNYLWPRFWDVSKRLPGSLSPCVQMRLFFYNSDFLFHLPLVSFNDCTECYVLLPGRCCSRLCSESDNSRFWGLLSLIFWINLLCSLTWGFSHLNLGCLFRIIKSWPFRAYKGP